jgi:hypothetical protein
MTVEVDTLAIYVPVAYDVVSYDTQCHKKALVLYRIPHRRKRGGKLNDSDKQSMPVRSESYIIFWAKS